MNKTSMTAIGLGVALFLSAAIVPQSAFSEQALTPVISVLKGEQNFLSGYDPRNKDGTYNVVIEIPAGTTAKYETNRDTGYLELEQKNGQPRFIQYLGYPANYGSIPRSMTQKGDGFRALVLGPALPRGSVVKGRLIGALSLVESGGIKERAIIVTDNTPFAGITSIADLDAKFPGVTSILQTWFTAFGGYGKDGKPLSTATFKGRAEAIPLVGAAILAYEMAVVTEADKRPLDDKGNPQLYRWPGAKNVGE